MKRTFLGSLSDFVVHNAEIPVIVVKHPSPDSIERYGSHTLAENLRKSKIHALDKGLEDTKGGKNGEEGGIKNGEKMKNLNLDDSKEKNGKNGKEE